MWLAHKTLPPRTDRLFSVIHLLKKSGPVKTIGVWLSMVFLKTSSTNKSSPLKDPLSSAHTVSCWDLQLSSGKANSNNATSPVLVHFLCSDPGAVGRTSGKRECFIDFELSCLHRLCSLREWQANKTFQGWSFVYFSFHFILLCVCVFARLAWRI